MKELYELKDKLCDELKEYGRKELSSGTLDTIDKLTHTIKNLDKIIEKHEDEEYSNRYAGNNMSYGHSMRGRNRDAMGRYSRHDGYSYHTDIVPELYELMEDAPDDATRQDIKRLIKKMESNRG